MQSRLLRVEQGIHPAPHGIPMPRDRPGERAVVVLEDALLETVAQIHHLRGVRVVLQQNFRLTGLPGVGIDLVFQIDVQVLVGGQGHLGDDVRGRELLGHLARHQRANFLWLYHRELAGQPQGVELRHARYDGPGRPQGVRRLQRRERLPGQALQVPLRQPDARYRDVTDLADGRGQVLRAGVLIEQSGGETERELVGIADAVTAHVTIGAKQLGEVQVRNP